MKLGINGMGRIGKLTLWRMLAHKSFDEIVINLGREVGQGLSDLAQMMEKDSSYGRLETFLHGFHGGPCIESIDEASSTIVVNGTPVKVLRNHRNPKDIEWRENGVRLVVDTTGVFVDPTMPADARGGSLRGHLEAGAEKVILSAPFKIKDSELPMPADAITTVMGINDGDYEPGQHHLISAASCTTTCLSYIIKPLMDHFGADRILSASMVTIHAATGSQKVLDSLPKAGAKDLRKNRSILNNIILTTTGAANALKLVIPEMAEIGFMAESVRVPTATGSLTILTVNLQDDDLEQHINRKQINGIYKEASEGAYLDYLRYTEEHNVSSDMIGFPSAATVIEGTETHTRTAFLRLNPDRIPSMKEESNHLPIKVPVTQCVIYGWYDNELGSYGNMLGHRISSVADQML